MSLCIYVAATGRHMAMYLWRPYRTGNHKGKRITINSAFWTMKFRMDIQKIGRAVELGFPCVHGKDRKHRRKTNKTATASWEEHAQEDTSNKRKLRPPASTLCAHLNSPIPCLWKVRYVTSFHGWHRIFSSSFSKLLNDRQSNVLIFRTWK